MARLLMMLLMACGLGACAVAQTPPPAAGPAAASASPAAAAAAADDYRLGTDDRISVTVFGEDDLSKEYVVSPNGMISVPLIGEVQAAGRTVDQLRDDVRTRLADGYLANPQVTMSITTFRPFFILGEVGKPGEYAYRDGLTVTAAVATAEGFTYRAQKGYAFIKHQGENAETRMTLTPDLRVRPGDTIRIGERYF